jgi:hypothetical protein
MSLWRIAMLLKKRALNIRLLFRLCKLVQMWTALSLMTSSFRLPLRQMCRFAHHRVEHFRPLVNNSMMM